MAAKEGFLPAVLLSLALALNLASSWYASKSEPIRNDLSEVSKVNIESQLLDTVRALTPAGQAEVLDFAEFIKLRSAQLSTLRPVGLCQGEFIVPDDFNAPLPESILRDFES